MTTRDQEQDKIASLLSNDIHNKNIVTQSEFAQYLPLFDNRIKIGNVYDENTLKNLIEKYRMRFNPHHPITIVSDDKSRVIDTRPPMFIQIPSLNNHIKKASELMTTYNNVMGNNSQPKAKKAAIGQVLHQAVSITIGKDENYNKIKEEALNMMEKKDSSSPSTDTTVKSTVTGMQWS